MRQVTLYSVPDCPLCDQTRAFLREHGVEFVEIDVRTAPLALHEAILFSGTPALPAVAVDGRVLVGFDADRLMELLAEESQS